MPDVLRCPVCSCAHSCALLHTRPRVQRAPGLPCALLRGEISATLGRTGGENAKLCRWQLASRTGAGTHSRRCTCYIGRCRSWIWLEPQSLSQSRLEGRLCAIAHRPGRQNQDVIGATDCEDERLGWDTPPTTKVRNAASRSRRLVALSLIQPVKNPGKIQGEQREIQGNRRSFARGRCCRAVLRRSTCDGPAKNHYRLVRQGLLQVRGRRAARGDQEVRGQDRHQGRTVAIRHSGHDSEDGGGAGFRHRA